MSGLDVERPGAAAWTALLGLHEQHVARLAAIDPLVRVPAPAHDDESRGRVLVGRDGNLAAWVSVSVTDTLWAANRDHRLVVRAAEVDAEEWGGVLDEWLAAVAADPAAADGETAASVVVAARDRELIGPLAARHFGAGVVLAVRRLSRTAEPVDPPAGVRIRDAGPRDLDWLADRAAALHAWDAGFGFVPPRPNAREVQAPELAQALEARPGWTWIAERDGHPVGFVDVMPPDAAAWATGTLALEPAGYLGHAYVDPVERSGGVGRALAATAHRRGAAAGWTAMLLHHAASSAWSAPFWAARGYRPLLTTMMRLPAMRAPQAGA